MEHIKAGQFFSALVLALPLLEAVMRALFVELNSCPARLLTGWPHCVSERKTTWLFAVI
jgi:hypothetical protein